MHWFKEVGSRSDKNSYIYKKSIYSYCKIASRSSRSIVK